ncbi:MAG: 4Fe-4S dicluster domain-containing protein [Elusimicrobiota bacterium]
MLKSLRGKVRINIPRMDLVDYREKKEKSGKDKKRPPSKFHTEDRDYLREKIIQSGVFTERELLKIEKVGCGRVTGNGMVKYPFIGYRNILLELFNFQIIGGLKLIMKAVAADYGRLIVPRHMEFINKLDEQIRRSPNIFLKEEKNRYPLGFNEILWKYIYGIKKRDNYFPGKRGNLVVAIEKLIKLYRFIDYSETDENEYVILNYEKINHLFKVNKNTVARELIDKIGGTGKFVVKNGLLSGQAVKSMEDLRAGNFDNLIILNNYSSKLDGCIGCGKCIEVCPQYLESPHILKIFKNGRGFIPFSKVDGCIGCGLCGFLCPGWYLE